MDEVVRWDKGSEKGRKLRVSQSAKAVTRDPYRERDW